MSVVIRMKRAGAKKRPFYRVVVADSRFARDGRYIEQLGYYDPLTEPAKFQIDTEKFANWIRKGARPSESVEVMMAKHAPSALRPVPLLPIEPGAVIAAEGMAPPAPKAKTAKKEMKEKKEKKAAPKASRKPRTATKRSEKKAKTRAKAKAKKASGIAKPRKAKKAKKSKK
jgi:small subunit ribosomal protein S16